MRSAISIISTNFLFGEIPEILTGKDSARLLTRQAIKAWLTGGELPAALTANGAKPELIQAIIQATLKPLLTQYAESLAPLVNQEHFRRRYCPICGGRPDFSFLDSERGSRWLLCSRCDTEWLFKRLECPFCDSPDQGALDYLADEKELYRLYTCQHCHNYLKTIDLRKTKEKVLLPLERLLTADMDIQAKGRFKADRKTLTHD